MAFVPWPDEPAFLLPTLSGGGVPRLIQDRDEATTLLYICMRSRAYPRRTGRSATCDVEGPFHVATYDVGRAPIVVQVSLYLQWWRVFSHPSFHEGADVAWISSELAEYERSHPELKSLYWLSGFS